MKARINITLEQIVTKHSAQTLMKPLVSICIPTYNGAKYLKECIDSAISQTFTDFEVLIVDNNSSDSTLSIAQAYAAKDRRFRVISNERNLGFFGNWERCVELAQGEWIKFVFQDDLIAPKCLERMLAVSQPEITIIGCYRRFIFEPGTSEIERQMYLEHASLLKNIFSGQTVISASHYCQVTLDRIELNLVGEPTAVMLHRSVFQRFGSLNPHFLMCSDLEFWARIAIHTGIIFIPEILATIRIHGASTSSDIKANSNRNYRASKLDQLVFLHNILFNSLYEPLRVVSAQQHPPVNLVNLFASKAYDARRTAERAATDSVNPDPSLLAEWKKFLQLYPVTLILLNQWEDKMRASVIYQDILQQGKQEEALSLVLRLASRRFGEIDSSLRERVRLLSVEQLEALAEALFNMSELADLVAWLSPNSAITPI